MSTPIQGPKQSPPIEYTTNTIGGENNKPGIILRIKAAVIKKFGNADQHVENLKNRHATGLRNIERLQINRKNLRLKNPTPQAYKTASTAFSEKMLETMYKLTKIERELLAFGVNPEQLEKLSPQKK